MMAGMTTSHVVHFVSPSPIPDFLYYASPANIAQLEELIAVTKRVGRNPEGTRSVSNLLGLYQRYTSVETVAGSLLQEPWGVSFTVENPIMNALREAKTFRIELPVVDQPERLSVQVPWTQIKAITLALEAS